MTLALTFEFVLGAMFGVVVAVVWQAVSVTLDVPPDSTRPGSRRHR